MLERFLRGFNLLREFSAFLLLGTAAALIWANIDYEAYHHFVETPLFGDGSWWIWMANLFTHGHPEDFTLHFVVNDLFMVLFFGIAGKEVAESFLPGGALSSIKKAAMPVVATAGGVLGPIAAFFVFMWAFGADPAITQAWAVPTATDIAYCWLFAGIIFGRAHPAVTFLLVLAVLDDLIGMLIIATYYTPEVHLSWLGLVVLAVVVCEGMRRFGVKSPWPYVIIGGTLAWFGLHNTGVHAALALVPIVPFMPHHVRDHGLFVETDDPHHDDTMNQFEHKVSPFVDVGLFAFGLANAGVLLNSEAFLGSATWVIFLALLVGKTLGIYSFAWVGRKAGLTLPRYMNQGQMLVLGMVAGIGFTVALFVTTVAIGLSPEMEQYAGMLKLGALLSFAAGPMAYFLAKAMGVQQIHHPPAQNHPEEGEASDLPPSDERPENGTRGATPVPTQS